MDIAQRPLLHLGIHDPHTAVFARKPGGGVLELRLAVADGDHHVGGKLECRDPAHSTRHTAELRLRQTSVLHGTQIVNERRLQRQIRWRFGNRYTTASPTVDPMLDTPRFFRYRLTPGR